MNLLDHGERKFPQARLIESSSALGWQGIAAELRSHPAGDLPAFQARQLEVTLAIDGAPEGFVSRKGDGLRQNTRVAPGTIWISPVGVSEDDIRITQPLSRILHIYLPNQPFELLSDQRGGAAIGAQSIRYLAGVHDELIRQIGLALLAEMNAPTAGGRLLAESLSAALSARLVQAHATSPPRPVAAPRRPPALDEARTRRVIDFMHAHLASDIGLAELAAVAFMSPFHFARLFKQRVGVPPHRYLAQLRLEAAKAMLSRGELPLTEIALASGFSDPANFSRAFRRFSGLTPSQFRAQHAGR